jgi:hypothetical protein
LLLRVFAILALLIAVTALVWLLALPEGRLQTALDAIRLGAPAHHLEIRLQVENGDLGVYATEAGV